MTTLPLVEKFHTVQGEGYNAGRDAMFIRFAGCNLDCVFADGAVCDTPWEKPQEKLTLEDTLAWVDAETAHHDDRDLLRNAEPEQWPMVVLTGGEPTMAKAFDELVRGLRERLVYIAVETNGTIWRDGLLECDHVTVAPKDGPEISHGHKLKGRDHDPTVHPQVRSMIPDEYRYVISGPDTPVPPYHPARRGNYLSPAFEADGSGQYHFHHGGRIIPGAAERCMEIVRADPRWRISLQTHKFLGVR